LYEITCSASGTISRIVRRSASSEPLQVLIDVFGGQS